MAAVLPDPGAQGLVQPDYDPSDVTVTIPLSVLGLIGDGPYASDATGQTALHWAAENGCLSLVLHLIKKAGHAGANIVARTDHQGQNPLHLAAAAGHAGLIPHLITPTTLDAADSNNQTALQLAVQHRQLEAATALAAAGASLGEVEAAAHTVCCAIRDVQRGSPPQLPLLLVNAMLAGPGAAVRVAEALRWPHGSLREALHRAAEAGCQEVVAKLVAAGADRDAVEKYGATLLALAAATGHAQLVPLLVTPTNINLAATGSVHGVNLFLAEPWSYLNGSPLFLAATADTHKAAAALLAAGAQAHTCDSSGTSALAVAAEGGHTSTVLVLLKALVRESQQQQQQQGQEWLVSHVATALQSVLKLHGRADCATRLLEVVLDVLGPGVAGEVCQAVQQLLQEALCNPQQQPAADPEPGPDFDLLGELPGASTAERATHLAEALLVGWVDVEERLHAARQPLVARLQRLVPGLGDARLQQEQQLYQQAKELYQQQYQQRKELYPELFEPLYKRQPVVEESLKEYLSKVVADAEAAAVAGQLQRAHTLLAKFATLVHQHQQELGSKDATAFGSAIFARARPPSHSLISSGLRQAAARREFATYRDGPASDDGVQSPFPGFKRIVLDPADGRQTDPIRPLEVYTTFLAAWVGARRQLQQLPQEVAGAVVAAVTAAREQEQQQQDAERQAAEQEPEVFYSLQALLHHLPLMSLNG